MKMDDYADKNITDFFQRLYDSRNPSSFGNAGAVVNIFRQAKEFQGKRLLPLLDTNMCSKEDTLTLTLEDISGKKINKNLSTAEVMKNFNELIGSTQAKRKFAMVLNQIALNRKRAEITHQNFVNLNNCLAFVGRSHNGQDEFLHIAARVFKDIGLTNSDIIAHTDIETALNSAMFNNQELQKQLDNASKCIVELSNFRKILRNQTGKQLAEVLLEKFKFRKNGVIYVIMLSSAEWQLLSTDYPEIAACFSDQFDFDGYSPLELRELFISYAKDNCMSIDDNVLPILDSYFGIHSTGGKAEVEQLYSYAVESLNNRLLMMDTLDEASMTRFTAEDIPVD
jgi:hypothetical protein